MSIVHLSDSSSQAGAIQDAPGIAIAHTVNAQANSFAVTAVVTDSGDLRLIAWKVPNGGQSITRVGDSGNQAGAASFVAISSAKQNNFIAAIRTASGKLKLIAWQLNLTNGSFARLSDSGDSEGAVSDIRMAQSPLGDGRVLVAVRNAAGNLALQNWQLDSDLQLQKVGDSVAQGQPAGAISRLALGTVGKRAFTAVRDSGGNLKVIVWDVLANGGLKRLGDSGAQGPPVSIVDAVSFKDLIVTAVRDSGGNLKLISWKVSTDGMTVKKGGDSGHAAGGVDMLACVRLIDEAVFEGTVGRVFTAVRTLSKTLKVIAWEITSAGGISRVEDFGDRPGTVDALAFAPLNGPYLSAVRDASDKRLRLDAWRLDAEQPPHGMADNLVAYDQSYFENTAQVITPGSVAPKGRIVVALGQPRDSSGYVARDLLDGGGSSFALNATQTKTIYPLDTATQKPATDNQLIRLQDGSLMGIKNGYVWSDLTPTPAWFNTGPLGGQSSEQARNAVFVFRSTDGLSWSLQSYLDAAVVANGDYGWPQGDGMGNYGIGGYDRTEIYQDPWTKNIYVSGGGDGGPFTRNGLNVNNHAGVVFVSKDNGVTWTTLHRFEGQGKGGAPYVMTSTQDHPLVVLNVWKGVPTLYWLEKGATSLTSGKSVAVVENGAPVNVAGDAGIGDLRGAQPCIARIGPAGGGRDRVWIAYATTNAAGRQVYKLCVATFGGGQDPTTDLLTTIQADDANNRAVCLGGFVQDDRFETQLANTDNITLFHWIDAPPSTTANPNGLIARFKLLCNVSGHYQSGDLSVANGARRTFNRLGIGDYFSGGYFEWNGKVNFLVQWAEPTKIMGNVVSITP
jgi:hypothetical protein